MGDDGKVWTRRSDYTPPGKDDYEKDDYETYPGTHYENKLTWQPADLKTIFQIGTTSLSGEELLGMVTPHSLGDDLCSWLDTHPNAICLARVAFGGQA